jgi:hypothetical protein
MNWKEIAAAERAPAHHAEPVARHCHDRPHRPDAVDMSLVVVARRQHGHEEQQASDREEDDEAGHGPVRDLGRRQHPDDEHGGGNEVEGAVREDSADQRRPGSAQARHVARQHGHARKLTDAAGQRRVRQQADREG